MTSRNSIVANALSATKKVAANALPSPKFRDGAAYRGRLSVLCKKLIAAIDDAAGKELADLRLAEIAIEDAADGADKSTQEELAKDYKAMKSIHAAFEGFADSAKRSLGLML